MDESVIVDKSNIDENSLEINNFSKREKLKVAGYFLVGIFFFIFWGLINVDGGFFGGGIVKFFEIFTGAFQYSDEHFMKVFNSLVFGLLLYLLLLVPIFSRENTIVQKLTLLITILFTYTLIRFIFITTSNLIFIYIILFFVSIFYYNYLKNGELKSLFDNPIVIFAFRRSMAIAPMFLIISAVTFFGINMIGDPVQIAVGRVQHGRDVAIAERLRIYGLVDESGVRIPIGERYLNYIYDFIHLDFGVSYERWTIPVAEGIQGFIIATLRMQIAALFFAFILSVILGITAAYYHRTPADSIVSTIALLGLSMPIFVSGILAILIFGGIGLGWFPVSGAQTVPASRICDTCGTEPKTLMSNFVDNWYDIAWLFNLIKVSFYYFFDQIKHLVLPVATLTLAQLALFTRLTRSTMLEILKQDYILAARANGLSERNIVGKHAFKNVLLPLVTFLGISIGTLLAGAPITETVFSYPGLGAYFIASLFLLDMPILMAITLIITIMILISNLITDITYSYLDPRITL
jgi:peptide/nickel transport system permease protein